VANIKSQIKRNLQNAKRHERNKSVRSSLKTSVRKFREATDAGDTEQAQALYLEASRQLDKAVSKGVIHANQAANKKSKMAKRLASASAQAA
jgi:small subunit ribosomal protein S20